LGVAQAGRDLVNVGKRIAVASEAAAKDAAASIQATTAGSVPYVTGNLRASLETVAVRDGFVVGFTNRAPYAGYIEFGGFHGRAYVPEGRYLWPTARATEVDYFRAVKDAATREVKTYPWHQQR